MKARAAARLSHPNIAAVHDVIDVGVIDDHLQPGFRHQVDGVLRACAASNVDGEVINVATGGRISLNELFHELRDLTGASVEPIYGESRAGDVRDSQADIGKARRLLGYEPLVGLSDGLRKTVEWYRTTQLTRA